MQDRVDNLIKEALAPVYEPGKELNQSILCSAKRKEKNNMKTRNKLSFAAAVAICVLCVGSVSVYAAVQMIKGTTALDYGITTNSSNISEQTNINFDSTLVGEETPSVIEKISLQEGKDNTPWLSKEVLQRTEYIKVSDDSIHWSETSYVVEDTIYTFADYGTATKEAKMDHWFMKEYELVENVNYVESVCEEEGINTKELTASFKYGKGYFELTESKDMMLAQEESQEFVLITNEVTSSNTYIGAQGYEFTLVNDEVDGKPRSCVAICYENYTGSLTFYDMTDAEVCHVLDTIRVK